MDCLAPGKGQLPVKRKLSLIIIFTLLIGAPLFADVRVNEGPAAESHAGLCA